MGVKNGNTVAAVRRPTPAVTNDAAVVANINTRTNAATLGNQFDGMGNNEPSGSALSGKGISLGRIWRFITVEPLILFYLLSQFFLYVAVQNFDLEKSCRVNFNYSDVVCDNMIDKAINDINCVTFREKLQEPDVIHFYSDRSQVLDNFTYKNGSAILAPNSTTKIMFDITELEELACQAEIDSQKLDTDMNQYKAPLESVFGIVMILFAGGWSDRRGKRKPCMLLPMMGELAVLLVYLIAAVFFKQLPLEFSAILTTLLRAITGGTNLMFMGLYSYLSETTAEADRTMRFGIFAQIVMLIPIVSLPWSGILYEHFGYIKLLLICIPMHLAGVLYIIFGLKEVERPKAGEIEQSDGVDNPAFEKSERNMRLHEKQNTNGDHGMTISDGGDKKSRNCLLDFFNPVVAVECLDVLIRKRENWGRAAIIFVFVMYFIANGPSPGESSNQYNFMRIALNWDANMFSIYGTYDLVTSLIGNNIMMVFLSKLFKISDPVLGIIGSLFSAVSRIIYTLANDVWKIYIASTFDLFKSVIALVIRSTLSKYVDADELGRLFSIIGIIDAISNYVFVALYSAVYKNTLESWPAAFYFISFIFLMITAILFAVLHFVLTRKEKQEKELTAQTEQAAAKQLDHVETTHM